MLTPSCGAAADADAEDDVHDSQRLHAMLWGRQHPLSCSHSGDDRTFKDWRNGLGAQLSSIVGAWAHLLDRTGGSSGSARLLASGGMRYANKARCPRRDLSCYFEPLVGCEARGDEKEARAAKTPERLAPALGEQLRFRRARDKWWLRRELTRFVFRPNEATAALLLRVCAEMRLHMPSCLPPALVNASVATAARRSAGADGANGGGGGGARLDRLVALHVRRGDKRDLGAKERGEPFSDDMYVQAAKAVASAVGADGFLLASSEPSTLERLPPLLLPLPTYVMPAHHFVQVPEGQTPHQVVEATKQAALGPDEGQSQIVQLLLLGAARAFVGTVTSNFGQLVTKLMSFATPAPVALDLSCAGLMSMRNSTSDVVWRLDWADDDAARCRKSRSKRKLRVV